MSEKLAIEGGPKVVRNRLTGWSRFYDGAIQSVEEVLKSGRVKYWTGPRGMEEEKDRDDLA
jgi:hypothetical protein